MTVSSPKSALVAADRTVWPDFQAASDPVRINKTLANRKELCSLLLGIIQSNGANCVLEYLQNDLQMDEWMPTFALTQTDGIEKSVDRASIPLGARVCALNRESDDTLAQIARKALEAMPPRFAFMSAYATQVQNWHTPNIRYYYCNMDAMHNQLNAQLDMNPETGQPFHKFETPLYEPIGNITYYESRSSSELSVAGMLAGLTSNQEPDENIVLAWQLMQKRGEANSVDTSVEGIQAAEKARLYLLTIDLKPQEFVHYLGLSLWYSPVEDPQTDKRIQDEIPWWIGRNTVITPAREAHARIDHLVQFFEMEHKELLGHVLARIGMCFFSGCVELQQELSKAEHFLRRACLCCPENPLYLARLATLLLFKGTPANEALEFFRKAQILPKTDALMAEISAHVILLEVILEKKDPKEALDVLTSLECFGKSVIYHLAKAQLFQLVGNLPASIAEYLEAIKQPECLTLNVMKDSIHFYLASAYQELGKHSDALTYYQLAIEGIDKKLKGYTAEFEHQIRQILGFAHAQMAYIYSQNPKITQKADDIQTHADVAVKYLKDGPEEQSLLGILFWHLGDFKKADSYFQRPYKSGKLGLEAHLYFSDLQRRGNNFKFAQQLIESAQKLDTKAIYHYPLLAQQAAIEQAIGHHDNAFEKIEKLLNANYKPPIVSATYAAHLKRLVGFDVAKSELTAAISCQGHAADERALIMLGRHHLENKEFPQAIDYFRRALKREPDNIEALEGLRFCHLGLEDECRATIERLRKEEKDPNDD